MFHKRTLKVVVGALRLLVVMVPLYVVPTPSMAAEGVVILDGTIVTAPPSSYYKTMEDRCRALPRQFSPAPEQTCRQVCMQKIESIRLLWAAVQLSKEPAYAQSFYEAAIKLREEFNVQYPPGANSGCS